MKLRIEINKCHGINSINETLNFNDKPVIIHAPNGTFKTSFCKTLVEWINGIDSYDVVTGVIGSRTVEINGKVAKPDEFEVFTDFSHSQPLSNSKGILLNHSLRTAYDTALSTYESLRDGLLNAVSKKYKISKIDMVICRVFNANDVDVALKKIYFKLSRKKKLKVFAGNYSDYFSDTIRKNVSKDSSKQIIEKYQKIYNKTLKEAFIKEGVFDFYNLINVSESLSENNYFDAGNIIVLNGEKPITTTKELNSFIDSIKNGISKDSELQQAFIGLETDFSKKGMNKVAENIKSDPSMALLYKNYSSFEESYLLDKFNSFKSDLIDLNKQYKISRKTIKKIKCEAKKDDEIWQDVIDTFDNRFRMPFKIVIADTPSAVLGIDDVAYTYKYRVNGNTYDVNESVLISDVLSEGESRVFSLLNTIFRIKELEKNGKHKILVFDDVADAFDYSNKHAIIEYLREISLKPLFDVLVLTHNFDFYRHFGNRVSGRGSCKFASSDGYGNITFSDGEYLKNLYTNYLRQKAMAPNSLNHAIAIVPFARAAEEIINPNYKTDDIIYDLLTGILHYRPNSGARITGNSYAKKVGKLLNIQLTSLIGNKTRLYKIIYYQAMQIAASTTIDQKIEEKIVLSMAMRIFGEKFMIYHLRKTGVITNSFCLNNVQFGQLLDLFRGNSGNKHAIDTLDLISIFTPIEIHVNGFAYEPLIDYSIVRLRKLFKDLDMLLGKTLRP